MLLNKESKQCIYIYIYIYFSSSVLHDVLLWTPTYDRAKAGRPARTYILQLCEDTGWSPEDLPEAMNDRERKGQGYPCWRLDMMMMMMMMYIKQTKIYNISIYLPNQSVHILICSYISKSDHVNPSIFFGLSRSNNLSIYLKCQASSFFLE